MIVTDCINMKLLAIFAFLAFTNYAFANNIVLILTDDLDSELDGMTALPQTRSLIGTEGSTYTNCIVASPICCPNRASILTGKYQHNHMTLNNSLEGGCSNSVWQQNFEPNTFASILKKKANYSTFYAGKYLNQYGSKGAGGISHVPAGWDNWAGLVGNSKYYDYSLSINGNERKYAKNPTRDYLTDVISNLAVPFINSKKNAGQPFLMVLAPPAPHSPFTPASRHNDIYKGKQAKRTPNFNVNRQKDKHWLVKMGRVPLPRNTLGRMDEVFRRRWETLAAVDELVTKIYTTLKSNNLLDDTYIIFTSDNGYHIGQYGMPIDKRQPYETDIKVPLLIRGPGVKRGSVDVPVSSVDLFATILDIAGTDHPSDGLSILRSNLTLDRTLLVEYNGEMSETQPRTGCPSDNDMNISHCDKDMACKCEDAKNNTYSCIRRISKQNNNIFCIFKDDQNFIEAYDLNEDQYQLVNIGYTMKRQRRYKFRKRLQKMAKCEGADCIKFGWDKGWKMKLA